MTKYIVKQKAISALINEANTHSNPVKRAYTRAAALIEQITAEDVQPMKRGKWKENAGYGGWGDTIYQCSECNIEFTCETGIDIDWNYCPNCGARMEGDTE